MHLLDPSILALIVFAVIGLAAAALVIVAVLHDGYGQVPDRNDGFATGADRSRSR